MQSVLMDVDTGIDDALALVYLLSRPEVRDPGHHLHGRQRGCPAGGPEQPGPAGTLRPHRRGSGRRREVPLEIPLVTTEETHGPQGIGYAELPPPAGEISPRHAVDVWVETVRANPGEITGLITGPLTNFALALRREPDLPKLLNGLVIMGGCFNYQGNTTPTAEWNVSVDPHAAQEVFAAYSGVPEDRLPVVCALETTERIEMRPEHLQRLAEAAGEAEPELVLPEQPEGQRSRSGNPLVACLSDAIRFYMEFHRLYDQGLLPTCMTPSLPPSRSAARHTGRGPRPSTWKPGRPRLIGTTVADFRGIWKEPANARIVTSNDPGQCFDELISSVGALARSLPLRSR